MDCYERYLKLEQFTSSTEGRWSDDEDQRLFDAVKAFGIRNWKKVSGYVKTRSSLQCMSHWFGRMSRRIREHSLRGSEKPEWTTKEDAILWFNRNSSSSLRKFSEISKILPRHSEEDIENRYKQLEHWYRQAIWLHKNKGTFLSFLIKKDSDLTLAEVDHLRAQMERQRKRLMNKHKGDVDHCELMGLSFADQGQLEQLTDTMMVEAQLSRDLVLDKIKLIKDIAHFKATPVPFLRNFSTKAGYLEERARVHKIIKESLLKVLGRRYLTQEESAPWKKFASKRYIFEGFSSIMTRFEDALMNHRTVDRARAILLRLEKLDGESDVRQLMRIAEDIDQLTRSMKIVYRNKDLSFRPCTKIEWADYAGRLKCILRKRLMVNQLPMKVRFYADYSTSIVLNLKYYTKKDGPLHYFPNSVNSLTK